MKRAALITAVAVVAFAAGSIATAATGWRTFATAVDKSDFFTYASANAKTQQPNGLAVRATGAIENVSWNLNCEMDKKPARAGLYVVSVATADSCSLSGSAIGGEGSAKIELLKR